ncbi:MAG: DUF1080 domain-containing protein [Bacteroidetes bacterium]|nr:DUF1080 domain-containing protein [Bacteroidota bacterium]MDA0874848.1 DUF1080 domain-containing protein [Bacteroidota bacterium]
MREVLILSTILVAVLLLPACTTEPASWNEDEAWEDLFDGHSLKGWTPKIRGEAWGEDARQTFRVTDSLLSVDYSGYEGFSDEFGHLFYDLPYSHYRLNVVYRFHGEQVPGGPGWAFRNSGVMIHSPPGSTMGVDQDFPISIEVQLLGGNGVDERSTANLCTPGTHVVMDGQLETRHCMNSSSPTFHGDQWVSAEILVLGDSLITHLVEGVPVLSYSGPQMGGGSVSGADPAWFREGEPLPGGHISLQSESHPVQFRSVRLLNLAGCMDPDDPSYRPWFEFNDAAACASAQQ